MPVWCSLVRFRKILTIIYSPKCRLEVSAEVDLRELGRAGVEWIHVAQNKDHWKALVITVMILRVRKILLAS